MERGRHILLGNAGEALAARELERRGYVILARRFRTRLGEIDIIARDNDTLVFVEVKTRRTDRRGGPADAVDRHKQIRLARIALSYLQATDAVEQRCRFDVVSVRFAPGTEAPAVQVIQGAFDAESAT